MKHETTRLLVLAGAAMFLLLLAPAPSARAAGITVTSTADTTANGDGCTLREAILNANGNAKMWSDCEAGSGADTITFGLSGTIRLNSALPNIADMAGLMIDGAGQSVIISGDKNGNGIATVPIFTLDPFASITVQNLTLAKGNAGTGLGGAIYIGYQATVTVANITVSGNAASYGGAIANDGGTITVANSIFSGNTATAGGGAISSGGPMTITNCIFSSNSTLSAGAGAGGGAILNGDVLTIERSTFSGNSASGGRWGGAVFNNGGTLGILGSTFSNNTTMTYGGGIANNFGTITIANSTFFSNTAEFGGGIWINDHGSLMVTNSTFGDNVAPAGNSVYNNNGSPDYTVTLRNTILSSAAWPNCGGIITNGGNNIDTDSSCGWASNNGSTSNTNPLLGPLANNGGPTQTMALQPTSPAIDAGNAAICALAPPNGPGGLDQRGVRHSGVCDIGAFESTGMFLPLLLR